MFEDRKYKTKKKNKNNNKEPPNPKTKQKQTQLREFPAVKMLIFDLSNKCSEN